jgi:coatomer protein complex subunit gamma
VLPIMEESSPGLPTSSSDLSDVLASFSMDASSDAPKIRIDPAAIIYDIPEFASFGRVFRSCNPVALTEAESEYVVHCVKHIMMDHMILQFTVQNTIEDQRLENISVAIDTDSEVFECAGELPVESIKYGTTASCFTILNKGSELESTPTLFNCELKFQVVNVDPISGEDEGEPMEEEYPLEDLEVFTADFVVKTSLGDFRKEWDVLGKKNEILQKFGLSENKIENAAEAVIDCMGMQPCDGTGVIKPGAKQHMLHLSGTFLGGIKVLARCQIALQGNAASILKMAIRSERHDVSKLISDCIC